MPLTHKTLTTELTHYLTEKYSNITLYTDIFEHAFLLFLGYRFVPEKCQFEDSQADNRLSILLRAPYAVETSDFLSDLIICATGEFSDINVKEINPNSNQGFCVQLKVPYSLIETSKSEIFQSIDRILADSSKKNFYRYWDSYARKYDAGLTIIRMEYLIRQKIFHYPHLFLDDIWSAVIQKNIGKNAEVKYLEKQVSSDVENFPNITLIYEKNGEKNQITLPRNQIVATLEDPSLDEFLISNALQEFIPPIGISKFIKEKYHRSFAVNDESNFVIDLGYHDRERKILEKYGIKELSSYTYRGVTGEQSRYYIYDKSTYIQLLLALKEIKGKICFDERWYQLTYYINNQMWEKLNKELKFLLNLKTEAEVEIDYTKLLGHLYQYAKNNSQEEFQENIFKIVEETCKHLVSEIPLQKNVQKEIYSILFELTVMRRNQLKASDENVKKSLTKDLFIFAQQAGLEESNHLLAEIAGLKRGDTLSSNVNDNLLPALVELAENHKAKCEENECLKNELAKLKTQISLQKNTINSNVNSASHFTFQR